MRKNPQYGRLPNRAELGRPRAASRKSMAIGGGKRKWRNAVGFADSLAAAAGVELSVYRRDRRCHGIDVEELVQVFELTEACSQRGLIGRRASSCVKLW